MSSFTIKAKNLKTGEIHSIWCMDDHFGKHNYGYIPNIKGAKAMSEHEFYLSYLPMNDQPSDEVAK